MGNYTNYPGVLDNSGTPQISVYSTTSGTALPVQAGTIVTDANHNNQQTAPMVVQLASTTSGSGHVIIDANTAPTFAATVTNLAPAASATDIAILNGSATKVIRVMRVMVSASSNSAVAATNDVQLILRTTANTGTSTGMTIVQYDSNDPAVTATAVSYTANPSPLGSTTGGGTLFVAKLVPTLNPFTSTDFPTQAPLVFQWGITDSKPIVLRGVAQGLAINLNGASMTGTAAVDITIEWTELAS